MKSKYFPIVTVGLALAVIFTVCGFGFSWVSRSPAFTPDPSPMAAPGLAMPGKEQVQAVLALQPLLPALATPKARPLKGLPLTLFGQRITGENAPEQKMAKQASRDHRLSLTLVSGPRRFCVVDGEFMTEGHQLSDGTRILKIKNQKVLIGHGQQTKWLQLDDPLDTQAADDTHLGKDRS